MSDLLPSDEEFENSLLELLNNATHDLHDIHGELLDAWYQDKTVGPLVIFCFAKLLHEDFASDLDQRYPDAVVFSLHLNSYSEDESAYYILLTHQNYAAIALFGDELTPEEFSAQLEFAKNEIN